MYSKEKDMEEKCAICGKPAKYISFKFISPLCEDCAKEEVQKIGAIRGERCPEVEDYYTEPCEEMKNVAKLSSVVISKG